MDVNYHPHHGIAQLDGFDESLRLLVEREEYSATDIALMFCVSRERIRQLSYARGITFDKSRTNGLNAVRVWNDERHCFEPVRKGVLKQMEYFSEVAERERVREYVRAGYRAHIVAALTALASEANGLPVSRADAWQAVSGRSSQATYATVSLAASWDSSRKTQYRNVMQEIARETGIVWLPQGGGRPGQKRLTYHPDFTTDPCPPTSADPTSAHRPRPRSPTCSPAGLPRDEGGPACS